MKKNFLTLFGLLLCTMLFAQEKTYQWARDISYTSSDDTYARERCKLDVYYPENATDCPVVVWFHGGGLTGGSKDIPMKLREKGMVVVGVNYRLLPKVDIATCIDDAAASVAWTFREISKYGGSTRKIFLSGHSAGGYLTTMLGLDKSWLAKYDIDADRLAGLIPFSGQMISHFSYRQMQGIPNLQPTIDRFAPLFHVRKDAPPLVLITGDRELELFGRYEENAYMRRMMLLVGHTQTTLYEIGGHDHGAMADPAFHILHQHVKKILEALPADTAQTVSILGDSYSTFYGHVTPRTNLCARRKKTMSPRSNKPGGNCCCTVMATGSTPTIPIPERLSAIPDIMEKTTRTEPSSPAWPIWGIRTSYSFSEAPTTVGPALPWAIISMPIGRKTISMISVRLSATCSIT